MLDVQELTLGYGQTLIVRGANLQLARGEIGCLLGASGCGKTTLLRAIAGFERVRAGSIGLADRALSDAAARIHVPTQSRGVGMVFQDHALFPHLRVGDNVAFGLHDHSSDAKRARVQEMLELVGLDGMAQRWPHELSGGQQQRVALARALAPAPQMLLLDEPFSSLDAAMRESLTHEVRAILKRSQTTALMVTHDQAEAFAIADRIGVMAAGALLQWDSARIVYTQPATRTVAQFIGEGAFLKAERSTQGWHCAIGVLPFDHPHYSGESPVADTTHADVFLRPEQLRLCTPNHSPDAPVATIESTRFRGSHFAHTLRLSDGQTLLAHSPMHLSYAQGAAVAVVWMREH